MVDTKKSEFVSLESHERRKTAVEKIFEESMAEIFPNLVMHKCMDSRNSENPKQDKLRENHAHKHHQTGEKQTLTNKKP